MSVVDRTELRRRFARRLSNLYGQEVPAYRALVDTCERINAEVADPTDGATLARVTEERHGAIRVGTPAELAAVGRVFGAMGMEPVGFYDLREADPSPVPVVSTAFRPVDPAELAINPFRVFVSVLVPEDRRFFDADLQQRIETFLGRRQLFAPGLLDLAARAESEGVLAPDDAAAFVDEAVAAFALSQEPVDRPWYEELSSISSVAADIAGVASTHVNHLTPRVLDIDELYRRMSARGLRMIDTIQGPPRWDGPEFLLRQTSFRALDERRVMREPDGRVVEGALRVRFGEVEARGMAATPAGRDLYEQLSLTTSEWRVEPAEVRQELAAAECRRLFPGTVQEMHDLGLGYVTFSQDADDPVQVHPITYEDFLPRSAAGIFASNLASGSVSRQELRGAPRDCAWLAGALGRTVHDPDDLYQQIQDESLAAVTAGLRR